jgi:hypothetical protein
MVSEGRVIGIRLVLLGAAALVLAAVVSQSAIAGTTECKGIKNCIDVVGPWVVVPSHGEATFLVVCPKKGTVGGVDAQATSSDVRVTFDGLLGAPVAAGTTTSNSAYFRALSARGRPGEFQPRVGCIPSTNSGRQTTSARTASPGAPLMLAATTVELVPGTVQRARIGCPRGSRFVSSWDATAFRTTNPPNVSLARAIHVQLKDARSVSLVTVSTRETLPSAVGPQVQLGVICAG